MEQTQTQPTISRQIADWLIAHPLFKLYPVLKEIGVDQGNFWRHLRSRNPDIKPETIDHMLPILKEYGFAEVTDRALTAAKDKTPPAGKSVDIKEIKITPATEAAFDGKKIKRPILDEINVPTPKKQPVDRATRLRQIKSKK